MAINFPSPASNGDIFGNYTYDSSIPGWRKTPENAASLPAGTIVQWPGATAPANWLICDGAAVSRTTYSSLFSAIGVQYGAGDGTTTFNLPNLKGRIAVGLDSSQTEFNTLGETGGAKTHTLTTAEMPSHTHAQDAHTHTFSGTTSTNGNHIHPGMNQTYSNSGTTNSSVNRDSGGSFNYISSYAGDHSHTYSGTTSTQSVSTNQNTGGGGAHNNLQPYIVLNYIIKASAGITSGDSELATRVGVAEADIDRKWESYNYVINGGFDIWQRGTAAVNGIANTAFHPDRWLAITDAVGTVNSSRIDVASQGIGSQYGWRLERSAGTNRWVAIHMAEGALSLVGRTVTLSAYIRKGSALTSNITIDLSTRASKFGTGYDYTNVVAQNSDLSSSAFTRFSVSLPITTATSTASADLFEIEISASQAGASNAFFDLAGVQLEVGPIATPFRRNAPSIQAELAACQRYFTALNSSYVYYNYGAGCTNTTSQSSAVVNLPVEMRARGTVTSSAASTFGSHIPGIEVSTGTSFGNLSMESTRTIFVTLNHNSSGNFGSSRACFLIANNTTNSYIYANAEL